MKKVVLAFALLLAAFALAACGGGDDDTTAAESSAPTEAPAEKPAEEAGGTSEVAKALKFEADPSGDLAFTAKTASWGPGEVTVEFNNPAPVPHNVAFEDENGEVVAGTEVITEDSETITAEFEPGTYMFICEVAGHREAGMEGTLTIK